MYVLTPSSSTSSEALNSLKELLSGTKAKIIVMSPKEHDKLAGVISHFPHIIAASLVHQAEYYQQDNQLVSQLAAGGFRDITRIASSSPAMWRDILLHNQDALLSMFDHWLEEMNDVRNMIERKDANDIYTYFHKRNNLEISFLYEPKERFHPFMISMWMFLTIRVLSQK